MLTWQQTGWMLFLLTFLFSVIFLWFPEIDIYVSAWFFDEISGFSYRDNAIFDYIRFFFIDGLTFLALLSGVMLLRSALIGARRAVHINIWGFTVATFLAGPIILANGILKAFWGRARPSDIEYFGGTSIFSPPLVITDQCASNCSFVSGEGSAISAAVIVLAIILWPNLKGVWRGIALFGVLPMSMFGISLRIITGRHFLSDTIFAILFCALVAWGFYRVFDMQKHRHALKWRDLRKDLFKA